MSQNDDIQADDSSPRFSPRFPEDQQTFATFEEAFSTLQQAQATLGFAISIAAKHKSRKSGAWQRTYYQCDRSGSYRLWAGKSGIYTTSSKKVKCPFKACVSLNQATQSYVLRYLHDTHNHDPIQEPLGSSRLRLLSQREFGFERLQTIVENRCRTGQLTAKEIARQIRCEYPEVQITDSDVYFHKRQLRIGQYGAASSTQAFLELLRNSDRIFNFEYEYSAEGKLWRVFWVYHISIEDWRQNLDLLLMDNTYKVNRFDMPLLQVTGITPLHTNFSVAFALAAHEDIPAFTWILTQLRKTALLASIGDPKVIITDFDSALKPSLQDVYPNTQQQVCTWHILKNVILNIRKKWVGSLEGCKVGTQSKKRRRKHPAPREVDDLNEEDIPCRRSYRDIEVEVEFGSPWAQETIDDNHLNTLTSQALAGQLAPDPDNNSSLTADHLLNDWLAIIRAPTETEFIEKWDTLSRTFPDQQGILYQVYPPIKSPTN